MKKIFIIMSIVLLLFIMYGCDSKKEEYINLTESYEECKKYDEYFQSYGWSNLYISSSSLESYGVFGRKYEQAILSGDDLFVFVEFPSSGEAVKAKAYMEKYYKYYTFSVYKNILFLNMYSCYLVLKNYIEEEGIIFSYDLETLVYFPKGKQYYEIPENIKTIACFAFSNTDIAEIKFNNNLKRVNAYAFSHCIKLKEIWFNKGLENIGSQIFNGCVILKNIYVPSGVKYISPYAFNYGNVFIDEEQIPSEWDPLFCSPYSSSDVKFFSKAYLNTEWEYNKEENRFIIK